MISVFVLIIVITGMLASFMLVGGLILGVWFIAKTFFPKSNFVEFVSVVFIDPEHTYGSKISDIKPFCGVR